MNQSETGSTCSRTRRRRRRRELFRFLLQKAKRKLRYRRRRRYATSEDRKIESFCKWCVQVGLELHPKIRIGRTGSCAELGVVASGDIGKGECLAVIPRRVLLTCGNSDIAGLVTEDICLMKPAVSSWVPLLITLADECSKKESSFWYDYLSLVPNNEECSPPMLWAESERHRLLEGTGLEQRVERDLSRIEEDFTELALPFMDKHSHHFSAPVKCLPNYLRLVAMVMSYSFTDGREYDFLSRTMMVPFVDLLNHHSRHHVELKFTKSSLLLMVIRDIRKGEEVMNTYGQLSNVDLLQNYGFTEVDNPHDEALISVGDLKNVFVDTPSMSSSRQERWAAVGDLDILEEEYNVDRSGKPCSELLQAVRLLLSKDFDSVVARNYHLNVKLNNLLRKEKTFLRKLAEHCLMKFPANYEEVVSCSSLSSSMSEKEHHALVLSKGQQNCLRTLVRRLQ